ncbi:hypothetical protein [Trichormus azollae]|uniref:Uncharacterized protein n=1 Tax=Nostoc azollae (strain 0708) TaxID=551115 RepID=D7E023_NOSA0|nr:hypothetical protein [Trichormus azollae]ADI66193.1 hypothetical protein Aazo_5120 ['Nostoc azollae' 0708]
MIYLLNIFIYLLTPLGGVLSYCSLLRIAFDAIFGALLFLQCLFSLYMFLFMLPWIFSLRNFSLWHFMVPNMGFNVKKSCVLPYKYFSDFIQARVLYHATDVQH